MPRARLGGLLAGVVFGALGVLALVGAAQAGTGGDRGGEVAPVAPPTTNAPALTTTTTTPGATTVPGLSTIPGPVVTAPPRGGAQAGTTAKPDDEMWSIRRIATTIGVIVAGLAVVGFVYGRIRSTTPRPPLAPTSD